MRLHDAQILNLLPHWMREDKANRSLAAGTDTTTRGIAARIKLLTRWDKLDQLSEAELDEMAWELNIKWYDSTAPIEAKRAIVRNSDLVYAKLGTGYAVERVILDYYGAGGIEEWFEYGGTHDHFRVHIEGRHISHEELLRFRKILDMVKRRSSWLDEIIITLPELRGQVPILPALGPRVARSAPPAYRARLGPGRIPAACAMGTRYSTVTLTMAVGRLPDRSFARRANDDPTAVNRPPDQSLGRSPNDDPSAASRPAAAYHEGG